MPKQIRKSIVKMLRNSLDTFDFRKVAEDLELREQVERARELLNDVSAEAIRNMTELGDRVKDGMAEVAQRLETIIADPVGREFRLNEF